MTSKIMNFHETFAFDIIAAIINGIKKFSNAHIIDGFIETTINPIKHNKLLQIK